MKTIVYLIILCVFSAASFFRNSLYRNDVIFWQYAVKQVPQNARSWVNLGVALIKAGRYKEATESLEHSLTLSQNNIRAFYNLGFAYKKTGNIQSALENLKKTLRLSPEYVQAKLELGNIYWMIGKTEQAEKIYDEALNLRSLTSLDRAKILSNLAVIYAQRKEFEEAKELILRAIVLDPDIADTYNTLANILKDKGELNAAIENYRKALEKNPAYNEARVNLALDYRMKKNMIMPELSLKMH